MATLYISVPDENRTEFDSIINGSDYYLDYNRWLDQYFCDGENNYTVEILKTGLEEYLNTNGMINISFNIEYDEDEI